MSPGRLALLTLAAAALACSGCSSPCCDTPPAPTTIKDGKRVDEGRSLFDGKSLGSWKTVEFGGEGEVKLQDGAIRVQMGSPISGIHWTGEALPRTNYEFSVEAMKLDGNDFFCGIVFPVGKETCSFVAGGWGGGVTGLSSVDQMNASENETASDQTYVKNQWYTFRLRVTPAKIEAWWDAKQIINLELANRQISVHPAVDAAAPLGLTTYETTSLFRNLRIRKLN
jgi:hypothetical protein